MDLGDVSAALATTGGMHRLREPACMSLFEFRQRIASLVLSLAKAEGVS